jgi:hypothetical protein
MFINWANSTAQEKAAMEWRRKMLEEEAMHEAMVNAYKQSSSQQTAGAAAVMGGGGVSNFYTAASDGNIYYVNNFSTPAIDTGGYFDSWTYCCDSGDGGFYFIGYQADAFILGKMDRSGNYTVYNQDISDYAQSGTPCALYREPSGSLIMLDDKFKSFGYQNIIRITIDDETGFGTASEVVEIDNTVLGGKIKNQFTYNGEIWACIFTIADEFLLGAFDIETGEFVDETFSLVLYKGETLITEFFSISNFQQNSVDNKVYSTFFINEIDPETSESTAQSGIFEINMEPVEGQIVGNFVKYATINYEGEHDALTLFNIN